MKDTLVLVQSPEGFVIDTVVSANDSITINSQLKTSLIIPDTPIKVVLPEPSILDIISSWAIIIGGITGLVGAIIAFCQLFKKGENQQNQIDELIKQTTEMKNQTQIAQAQLRMITKPRLNCDWGGVMKDHLVISIFNYGEKAFYDFCEFIEGDKVEFPIPPKPIQIEKDNKITISAPSIGKERKDIKFKFKLHYHDQECYKYETVFEWNAGALKFISVTDLDEKYQPENHSSKL